jgi:O-antigen biosynthesis protein
MTHTIILTPDLVGPIQNGGIGTFTWHFAHLLRTQGDRVTILFTGPLHIPQHQWMHSYTDLGITVLCLDRPLSGHKTVGNYDFLQRSEWARQAVPDDVDVIYVQDWRASGFQWLRDRRFHGGRNVPVVTILHSPTSWLREGMRQFPDQTESQLALDYAERYSLEHSDYVLSPSRYLLDWVTKRGWKVPPAPSSKVLGYPFFPSEHLLHESAAQEQSTFRKLIFFGRLETRKGFPLFLDTLRHLVHEYGRTALHTIQEIVLLGKDDGQYPYPSLQSALDEMQVLLPVPIRALTTLSTQAAQSYLHEHAAQALVVMPSLVDNFPYTVIEASLIPRLSMLCSSYGGTAEILGGNIDSLFEPFVKPFAERLRTVLTAGSQPTHIPYAWQPINQDWVDFHEGIQAPSISFPSVAVSERPTVDICIAHYNHGRYLPQLLEALASQTAQAAFGVIVLDDASSDAETQIVLKQLEDRYKDYRWQFIHNTTNLGLSQTRNRAVTFSQADYIIFMDADNLPAPDMVMRMTSAIQHAGDDCLTSYMLAFEGEAPAYNIYETYALQRVMDAALYRYLPLGACAELGMFMNSFGDANFIIRRQVFEALGGFDIRHPSDRHIAGEDHAFLARLVLAGYKLDVIPEFLFHYRYRQDSLFRTTDTFSNHQRTMRVYRDYLASIGMGDLAPLAYGLFQRAEEMPMVTDHAKPEWIARRIPWFHLRDAIWLKIRYKLERWQGR